MAEAKNRIIELMNRVLSEGPQPVRRRKDAFVVLTETEYDRLAGKRMVFNDVLIRTMG